MLRFENPFEAIKNIISPPKQRPIPRSTPVNTGQSAAQARADRENAAAAAEEKAADKARAEARRKQQAEAQKRQGRARTTLFGSGGNVSGLQTGRTTLLGGGTR